VANQDNEEALIGLRTELLEIQDAEAIAANTAVMEYFGNVREAAVKAMLSPNFDADERTLWTLRVTAQTVDKFFEYLSEKRDLRAFVEAEIKANSGEST
jgi:hypothetical protein